MNFFSLIVVTLYTFGTLYAGQVSQILTSDLEVKEWVPVTKETWAVFLEEPSYHFNLAMEYVKNGDRINAVFAIRRGEAFLIYQKNRIDKAYRELNDATDAIKTGELKNLEIAEIIFQRALRVLHRSESSIPIATGSNRIFREAYQFHFARFQEEFKKGNKKTAKDELNRCAAFFNLRKAQMRDVTGNNFSSSFKTFKNLTDRFRKGKLKDIGELEKAYEEVRKTLVTRLR
ncbi:MAG: hypothetical protein HQK83_08735 [Fibrobacteria bacterium]|nr:hypothetical protein [Fibrobacteria bacterium]